VIVPNLNLTRMRTLYRLYLTTDERATLESWVKKGKHSAKKVQYAQILLNSDENVERKSSTLLKDVIGVSVKTIERVRRRFCEVGMELFTVQKRKTRSDKKIDGRVEAHLSALLCQSPPEGKSRWELKLLSAKLVELQVVEHISTTMVSRLIKKTNSSLFKSNNG
jgi:transposase